MKNIRSDYLKKKKKKGKNVIQIEYVEYVVEYVALKKKKKIVHFFFLTRSNIIQIKIKDQMKIVVD